VHSRTPPVWAAVRPPRKRGARPEGFAQVPALLQKQLAALPSLLNGLAESAKAAAGLSNDPDFASLLEAPRTIFNANVTAQRRVATQTTSLDRLKAIARAAEGSLNDVVLAACSAGLRRYLREMDALPAKTLIASIPVALPRDADEAGGNAVTMANVRLGTDIDDVRKRFEVIRRSSAIGRAKLRQMDQTAIIDYTVLVNLPQILTRLPGVGARIPPLYNVIISNVPGPPRKIYFLGAEMEAYFPISALAHGQALNITVMSYAGGLYFGFTACHDRVPSIQRLAVYTGEAIDELEAAFVARRPSSPKARVRAAASRPARKRSKSRGARARSA
jgi:WS/DGAT/MGAT family acyltransferase